MRTAALSVPPHSVFFPRLSAKRGNASPRKFRSAPRFAAFSRERRQEISCARRLFPSRRPHSVFSQLSEKRGTSHPGNPEAHCVSQPCPANTGKEYHAHDASYRPAAAKRFLPTFRKAPERLTPEIPKRAAFRSLAPRTQARNIMRTAALTVPPPQSVFSPSTFRKARNVSPRKFRSAPRFAAFSRERRHEISCARRLFPSRRPHSVFSQLSEKRRSWPAPRRRFPSAEAAPGGAILESFFPNALEYALKAHSKQKRR